LLLDLLADAQEGVASPLERSYVRGVERAHGLPPGLRNHADGAPGRRRYRDVCYRAWRLVVESRAGPGCILAGMPSLDAHPVAR